MKTTAQKVQQVWKIADKIQKISDTRRAARYFSFWILVINKKPLFNSRP